MNKTDLLKHIAETGYNIGYGAKKHFATFDITSKAPGTISFLTFGVGLFFLLLDFSGKKYFSVACIILGMIGLRVTMWNHKKDEYSKTGRKLTDLFNQAKALYYQVKASKDEDLSVFEKELSMLQNDYNKVCLSEQILFSDWYAHYKFFWQQQIDWIDEQLHFKLLRDRLPLSFSAFFVTLLAIGMIGLIAFFLKAA